MLSWLRDLILWLWDFILGREHKKPTVEGPKYDPFTDARLHKIEHMDEYLEAMKKEDRCPVHGVYYGYGEFSKCGQCISDYYTMIKPNQDKIRAMGIDPYWDLDGDEFLRFRIVAKWLKKGKITEAEARDYGLKLKQSIMDRRQERLKRERHRQEQNAAASRPVQRLSELISK